MIFFGPLFFFLLFVVAVVVCAVVFFLVIAGCHLSGLLIGVLNLMYGHIPFTKSISHLTPAFSFYILLLFLIYL